MRCYLKKKKEIGKSTLAPSLQTPVREYCSEKRNFERKMRKKTQCMFMYETNDKLTN